MESWKVGRLSALAVAVGLVSQGVQAAVALDPQSIDLEPFRLVPSLSAELRQDDNIYNLSSNEVDSLIYIISPSVSLVAQDRENSYSVDYGFKAGFYDADGDDNYIDHNLNARGHFEPNGRFRFNLGAGYSILHDDRGTGATSGLGLAGIKLLGEPDQYTQTSLSGGAEYGAQDAAGLVVFNAGINQKRYDRDLAAQQRDFDGLNTLLGFRLRLMPKTTMLLDYEREDTNYKANVTPDTLDSRYLIGLSWENSAQTTGKVRLGNSKRDVSGGADISGFTWDAGVVWSPLEYAKFTFDGGERTTNGDFPAVSVDGKFYTLGWNHDWSERVSTRLSYDLRQEEYENASGNNYRSDDSTTIALSANYQMRRWLVLGASISNFERDSNLGNFDNNRNIIAINAQASL